MAEQTTLAGLDALQREVRFTLPFFAQVVVVVSDPANLPDLEGRHQGYFEVTLADGSEAEGPLFGARTEWFRAEGFHYMLIPADVYPWLDRHPDVIRYLRSTFRQ